MKKLRQPLSESVNNKMIMVRNVFKKKRFDELQDEILKGFADELRKYDSLVTDLANELEKALNENEMLKGRILDLAGRVK